MGAETALMLVLVVSAAGYVAACSARSWAAKSLLFAAVGHGGGAGRAGGRTTSSGRLVRDGDEPDRGHVRARAGDPARQRPADACTEVVFPGVAGPAGGWLLGPLLVRVPGRQRLLLMGA